MLSLTSDFYLPAKRYRREGIVYTSFVALDGTHIVEMRQGKFHVKHLGVTFVFNDGTWELSHYCEKQGLRDEQVDKCLSILNERYLARDWASFLDAQEVINKMDENDILVV